MSSAGIRAHRRGLFVLVVSLTLLVPSKETAGDWFLFGGAGRRYSRCVELYEQSQREEARECIREFLAEYPHSRWVEHLQFLDARMETDVSEALVKWRRFLIEFPRGPYSAEANFNLAEIYQLKGDPANAYRYYSHVYLFQGPNRFRDEAGLRMIKCALLSGDIDSAKKDIEHYLTTHQTEPWKTRVRELYADALFHDGEYEKAHREYKAIVSEATSPAQVSPRCYLRIAETYEKLGDYESAFRAYRRFLNVYPDAVQTQAVEQQLAVLASRLKIDLSGDRSYVLEAGVFESDGEALGLVARLKRLGFQPYLVTRSQAGHGARSVRLGPYESRESALAAVTRLNEEAGLEVTLLPQGGPF